MKLRYYSLLQFVSFISSVLSATANSKRGLVYVSSSDSTLDDRLWTSPTSNLSWYYNYKPRPSPNLISSQLEFVPMLWGASSDSPSSTEFLDDIRLQIRSPGESKIRYILGFNEPDGDHNTGGSNIAPDLAAKTWIRQLEPLRLEDGVKLGGPSVTGSQRGLSWLENFFKACEGRCHIDFLPIHFYGDFQGLASYMGQVRAAYPNTTIWVTEYAKANANLKKSQGFFNTSLEYFDRLESVYPHPFLLSLFRWRLYHGVPG
ncbi:MAG: hypothetical protein M1823_000951 [Watsoniomyces obsoletus]|nr:MAG: hypothetical protein M1823_000951 [Watsoniomyces obsoletus]